MPNTPARLAKVALTTSSVTVYTVPESTTAIVTEILVANTTATAATANVSLGGTVLVPDVSVPAKGVFTFELKQVMLTTETITALASATGMNIFISGVQVT